jgi:hypothetical protein
MGVFWTIAELILEAMVFTLPYFVQKYQYAMETALFFLLLLNHSELNLSHGICPECLKKTELHARMKDKPNLC